MAPESILETLGLDFGGFGEDFRGSGVDFGEICGSSQRQAEIPRGGWAAMVPPGGFQSAGHRRCANGVPNHIQTGSVQSQLANLDILSRNSI